MKIQSLLCFVTFAMLPCATYADEGSGFEPVTDVDAIQANQRKEPDDVIWWNVGGEQMRWMHLNAVVTRAADRVRPRRQ